MKKKLFIILILVLIFTVFVGCNNQTITTETLIEQEPNVSSGYLTDKVQDGTILHAWNWSMNTVEQHLEEIAIAGFSSVQISPMQPQKDYFGTGFWDSQWWKLYQPLGFSIATENHSLGTKSDLESLTEAADEYGIKIIVDVVLNHLAGGDNQTLNPAVSDFEPEIYNQNLIRINNGYVSDSSVEAVTRGALGGFPDLQTESTVVKERVLSLLKEYVDVGVDGFRFDAAKHIETPYDGEFQSDFWPFIINGVQEYASGLGLEDLYFYGEILNTPGNDREFTYYTEYMSVTASGMSDAVRQAVIAKNPENIVAAEYLNGVDASQTVLWAESHDTYANDNGATKNTPDAFITKAYVVQASRKNATSLYFARPNSNTFIGSIGSNLWQSLEVSEINRFHNYFVNTNEYLSASGSYFINERYNENKHGLLLVAFSDELEVKRLQVNNIPDGSYFDNIGKSFFTVKNGLISGEISDSGIAIIYNNPYEPKPSVYVSDDGTKGSFEETKEVTIFSHNTTSAYYSINGGEKIAFSDDVLVVLSHPDDNALVTLDLEIYYNDYKIIKQFIYTKSNIVITEVTVNNISVNNLEGNQIVAWVWPEGEEGRWVSGELIENTFVFDIEQSDDYFLLALFSSEVSEFNWEEKLLQTNDAEIPNDGLYDGSLFVWN